ncbi:type II toxin-antitoxin system HipA family toxin [Pseudaquidulcibacter saccharophilus]|uniref:type II toxin-antitoxin system HipA family toxin n=1 Tax=Pseudaquidulcibacter saccharophilus TaxID=2831900 RepID=UPI001EFF3115|nr:type II toxin-antitoxin system HipA family toxin [Pseudaquidulcibacter saccharophilus]
MEHKICVSIDLDDQTHIVGTLWARQNRGRESSSFEYSKEWLENPKRFSLEPALQIGRGSFHTQNNQSIFGAFGDSAPDRWGRVLIQRMERRTAREENRPPKTIFEIDYLLGVGDRARQGALRFSLENGSPYLAIDGINPIPPLIEIPKLLNAANRFANDEETPEDLRLLLAPGSSLGGARPKASIIDKDGSLAIAKFPKPDDEINISAWEAVALTMARDAKIPTPDFRIENIDGKSVLILQRFDRQNGKRIPFLSAMSMLGAEDNQTRSYMEIADALRQYGAKADDDCAQLWRRIVFNIMIANTDDHLRNHGFLYEKNGWRLSPAYDLNPVPLDIKPRVLSTAINEVETEGNLEIALEVSKHFGLKLDEAKNIISEVKNIVSNWKSYALKFGISNKEIERMTSAFDTNVTN